MTDGLKAQVEAFVAKKAYRPGYDAATAVEELLKVSPELEEAWGFDGIEAVMQQALSRRAAPLPPHKPAQTGRGARRGPAQASKPKDPPEDYQAGYRFVEVEQTVARPQEGAVDLNRPVPGGVCAEVEVEWRVETPILIGESARRQDGQVGIVTPMTLKGRDDYIIPGATLRGMVRAATEIVALARLGPVNTHHRYGLRDFEHPAYKEDSPVSKVSEVHAGWLTCSGDPLAPETQWSITPTAWAHLEIEENISRLTGKPISREDWIKLPLKDKYERAGMVQKGRGDTVFNFEKTFSVRDLPGEYDRRMVGVGGERQGVLICSDKLPGKGGKKRLEYVFYPTDAVAVPLARDLVEEIIRLYSRPSANRPAPDGTFKLLLPTLKAGKRVPVFYVGDLARQDGYGNTPDLSSGATRFCFGFTRLFKVPHQRSVGEVIAEGHKQHVTKGKDRRYDPDIVEALFGYVMEPSQLGYADGDRAAPSAVARRGRVAFSLATLKGPPAILKETLETVMSAPRGSFAPFYLAGTGALDYSASTPVQVAGRKRYLPRDPHTGGFDAVVTKPLDDLKKAMGGRPVSHDVRTALTFLKASPEAPLTFTSRIRFHNVSAAELGAVLFALTHGGDRSGVYRHMLGRGKAFGAGQTQVAAARLTVIPNDATASVLVRSAGADDAPCAGGGHSHRPFLAAFVAMMRRQTGAEQYPDLLSIRQFLGSCRPVSQEEAGQLASMPLNQFGAVRKNYKQKANGPEHTASRGKHGRLLPAPEDPVGWKDG